MELAVGTTLLHYLLEEQIGAGGMGTVWAARDTRTGRAMALKVLRVSDATVQVARVRLLREAHATRSIRHPAIVPVVEVLDHDGGPVLVMERLYGETLRKLLGREECLPLPRAAELLLPVAGALSAAHAAGIVHRDVKPENIFIEAPSDARRSLGARVRLLDFGVARFYEPPPGTGNAQLTGLGTLLGTLSYMAPEQALRPAESDQRVDVWALGIILYEALSGCRPIEGNTGPETMRQLLVGCITPLEVLVPGLPPSIAELLARMLTRAPERRTPSLDITTTALRSHVPAF